MKWSEEKIKELKKLYIDDDRTICIVSEKMGLSYKQIERAISRCRFHKDKNWTKEEEETLRRMVDNEYSNKEISQYIESSIAPRYIQHLDL